jgi:hypothetical protein
LASGKQSANGNDKDGPELHVEMIVGAIRASTARPAAAPLRAAA